MYAADAHAVAVIPTACVFPHAPYTLQMGRLSEIHFSGSLLIRQGVGWVDKPNILLLFVGLAQPTLLINYTANRFSYYKCI